MGPSEGFGGGMQMNYHTTITKYTLANGLTSIEAYDDQLALAAGRLMRLFLI